MNPGCVGAVHGCKAPLLVLTSAITPFTALHCCAPLEASRFFLENLEAQIWKKPLVKKLKD